ncbi:hypothetical protein KSC_018550 [Ktedonobacter sp. SOSP1-52]|uniref:hypothetical protein n=1 Tax=Ktedonobacter sp. SOSP1-52 TaxID=2778366 RepID=UPI001916B272|nr:hypothetical protein [Ktedonobacter sp. SOSP1-52]GHO62963.1 hypothetical protein KSC_018550 [Ktedonobacter sp. SOSP1-52]
MLYTNTDEAWEMVLQASKHARYLGLVDPGAIVDRKNPQTHVFASPAERVEPEIEVVSQEMERSLLVFPDLPSYFLLGYRGAQRYHLEVLCEKTSMDDVLLPICENGEKHA